MAAVDDDFRRGAAQSGEDLAIAALVVAPFVMTMVILLLSLGWLPLLQLVLLTVVAQIAATVWNAGWRARDEEGEGA